MTDLRILLVDDDDALRATLADALEALEVDVVPADSGQKALDLLANQPYPIVITDLVMPGVDGMAVLQKALEQDPMTRVLLLTGHGSREVAVEAMEEGAAYYLQKPVDLKELRTKVSRSLQEYAKDQDYAELRQKMAEGPESGRNGVGGIVGQDAKMLRVIDVLRQIAPTNASVLILGPSGTGKELVARAVHDLSPRAKKPFVAINCGGLAEGTIESELFGHVKGAYTGAVGDREGKFEAANGGTLFLDEVGEMPLTTQVKLLRVLEERTVSRLGSNQNRPVDVRVLAATNADLKQRVAEGDFREDLFYRLKVVTIELPSLRERRGDVRILSEHFLQNFAQLHGKDVESIDRDAMVALMQYDWPGNVRELRNCIESMVVRARGNILTRHDLPPEIWAPAPAEHDTWMFLAGRTVDEVERHHIRVTLDMVGGNRQKAARSLGVSERTLYRKIKEFGL